ncbi:transcriptional regulator [Colwellia sp. 75C3]|uniref:transcriptional regulator n=1 Tax=Colwellia sp. 75C3 TaxID=888425 RepID=UPI000C347364|nr:transcriptional regulator [Colwellia sp. 75C3]PKG84308.1 transcriptional regulator [Colwellia sp. 75C3]
MSKQAKSTSTQHANATTTPEMRAFIHESDLPTAVLARLLKVSESTVRKWRKRESLSDASHVPKQLNTTLSEAQEYVVVELRTRLLLSLDELLAVCKQFINANVSRAGLQRCLKRHGVSRLTDMQGDMEGSDESYDADASPTAPETVRVVLEDTQAHQQLTSDISPKAMREVLNRANSLNEDEVVQVKVTQIPDFSAKSKEQQNKCRLLIANDPTSSWVYVDIYDGNESEAASRYMSYVLTKAPFHIRRILAGNYNEFLSRFRLLNESPDEATSTFSSKNFHGSDTETE